jgi:hypothetical protein
MNAVFQEQKGARFTALYVAGGHQIDIVGAVGARTADATRFVDSFRVLR